MSQQILFRRDTAANWATVNPVLAEGEMGLETDTKQFKLGDGVSDWNTLDYGGIQGAGLVVGGTAGQFLKKQSGVDYDAAWTNIIKDDVGLNNVDNTSDANKPVSTAQAAADSSVQSFSIQRANHTGTQTASTVSDFDTAARSAVVVDSIADTDTTHAPSRNAVFDALALKEALANKGVANGYAGLTAEGVISPSNAWSSAPEKYTVHFDEFISDGGASSATGTLGWNVNKAGTGSSVVSGGYADVFNLAQGSVGLYTGTTATGRTCINLGPGTMGCGYSTVNTISRVAVPILSTVTEEFIALFGYGDNFAAGTTNTNGINFVYDRLTSVNWLARCTSGGVTTNVDTGIAVGTGFARLEIAVNANGTSVDFKINGATVATITTNIPGFLQQFTPYYKIVKSAGTTSRGIIVDYWSQKLIWTSAR